MDGDDVNEHFTI